MIVLAYAAFAENEAIITLHPRGNVEDEDVAATVGENGLKLGAAWAKARSLVHTMGRERLRALPLPRV